MVSANPGNGRPLPQIAKTQIVKNRNDPGDSLKIGLGPTGREISSVGETCPEFVLFEARHAACNDGNAI